jgi:hypothetical protein
MGGWIRHVTTGMRETIKWMHKVKRRQRDKRLARGEE